MGLAAAVSRGWVSLGKFFRYQEEPPAQHGSITVWVGSTDHLTSLAKRRIAASTAAHSDMAIFCPKFQAGSGSGGSQNIRLKREP